MTGTWLLVYFSALVWSAVHPHDYPTWWMEVAPALIGFALLFWTRRCFLLTPLLYLLILIHCLILMVGGHYTYAEVPLFDHLRELFGWQRNNYDKLGHFAQGFIPAVLAREILIRRQVVVRTGWLLFICTSICLAFSAFYELVEWWVAVALGSGANAFLGTQGYVWDTQSDMMMALIGALTSLLVLSRLHDRQISAIRTQE